LTDKNTGKALKNLESVTFKMNYCKELKIGHTNNEINIWINRKYFNRIFSHKYDFENYIIMDCTSGNNINFI